MLSDSIDAKSETGLIACVPSCHYRLPRSRRANADIAVFELRDGNFRLRDSDGETITARRRLITQMTIKDGRVWYERTAE